MATATALYAYYTFCHCSGSPRGLPTSVRKSCSYNHHREMHTHHCMAQHLTPFYLYKPISKHIEPRPATGVASAAKPALVAVHLYESVVSSLELLSGSRARAFLL